MNQLPMIKTKRLILRDITLGDAFDMYEYAKDPYVGPSAGWAPHTSVEESKAVIGMFIDSKRRGNLGVFAVTLIDSGKMIGTIELYNYHPYFKAELGYALSHYYWGQGYMAEAARGILKWGFEVLNLKRIEVGVFPNNHQSMRVCEKLGFTYEGLCRKAYLRYDGVVFDKVIYGMTDEQYYKMKEIANEKKLQ